MKVECICPKRADGSARHPEDDIALRDRLSFRDSIGVRNALALLYNEDPDASVADVLATMTESYLLAGIERWSVVDEEGKPVEPTKPAIRRYLFGPDTIGVAMKVADAADDLYREAVMAPLVAEASTPSETLPTEGLTSPPTGYSDESLNRWKPSSTSTTPMDDTETTSRLPAGVSNS